MSNKGKNNDQNSPFEGNGELKFRSFKSFDKGQKRVARVGDLSDLSSPAASQFPANVPPGPNTPAPYESNYPTPAYEATYSTYDEEENNIDVRDYLGVILHRRYWLVASLVVVVLLSLLTKIHRNPDFKSTSRLRVLAMTGIMDPFYGYDYISDNMISTHIENLKSFKFLNIVAQNLSTNLSPRQIGRMFKVKRTREANIINITVTAKNADLSSELANLIATEYDKYDLKIKQKAFLEYEYWINSQMKSKKAELNVIEGDIKEFYKKNPIFYTKGDGNNIPIKNYDKELTDIKLDIAEKTQSIHLLDLELAKIKPEIITDVTYKTPLKGELLDMKVQMAQLSSKYGKAHPKIVDLKEKMQAIRDLIKRDSQNESSTTQLVTNPRHTEIISSKKDMIMKKKLLLSKRQDLLKLQKEAISNLTLAPELEQYLNQLTRSKESIEKMYFNLQEKLQDTQLKKSATPREIFLMDNAPDKGFLIPKQYISFGLSILLGLAVGIGICFLIEFMDSTVQKSKDVETKYGLKLLGLIPKDNEGSPKEKRAIEISSENELMKPHFEPYRRLLENLFPVTNELEKTVVVTSALQGEGKTTTAANLAATAAMKGENVLIIDADMRRHNLHNMFGIENNMGLSDLLNSNKEPEDVVQRTLIPNLSIITAGLDPLSLTQSSAKNKLKVLISKFKKNFDLVIFDSPPILQLVDTLSLAPLVSRTLVVFRSKKTPLKAGEEVLRQLNHIRANVAGGVLNDVSRSFWDQYYYQYYKYGYQYNYK